MQFYIVEIRKKVSLNFNDNNNSNNNNNIYSGNSLALAVFSGDLQIINDKITTTTNQLL